MAERMTVNHDVTGSSPVRGAKALSYDRAFFIPNSFSDISLKVIVSLCETDC